MTFWCNCFMSIMTSILDISSRFNSLIGCSWTTHLTPVVKVIREFTCMFIMYILFFMAKIVHGERENGMKKKQVCHLFPRASALRKRREPHP